MTPTPLYTRCRLCSGTRLAPPDHRIHESHPDHSDRLRRPHRPGRVPCPECLGQGYLRTAWTVEWMNELIAELTAYREGRAAAWLIGQHQRER